MPSSSFGSRLSASAARQALLIGSLLLVPAPPAFPQAAPASEPLAHRWMVPTPTAASPDTRESLDALLYDYSLYDLDTATLAREARREGRVSLYLGGRSLDLILEPHDLRGDGYRAVVMMPEGEVELAPWPAITYRGRLADDETSMVRLAISEDRFDGYIHSDREWLFIDPLPRYAKAGRPGQVVVYRDTEVRPATGGTCGWAALQGAARQVGLHLPSPETFSAPRPIAPRAPRVLQIATDSDGQHYRRFGIPGTYDEAQAVLNMVDGVFRLQLNVAIEITHQQAWPNPVLDPYDSFEAGVTLGQFRDWWNQFRGGTVRDTAHLFSGKDLAGGAIGLGYTGTVCANPSHAYALSEDQPTFFTDVQIAAHEIGHNIGAGHDDEAPVCAGIVCDGAGEVMCSSLQPFGFNQFSNCSKGWIALHLAIHGACVP